MNKPKSPPTSDMKEIAVTFSEVTILSAKGSLMNNVTVAMFFRAYSKTCFSKSSAIDLFSNPAASSFHSSKSGGQNLSWSLACKADFQILLTKESQSALQELFYYMINQKIR